MSERFNPYSTATTVEIEYRQMKQRIAELEQENAELEAEVERLKDDLNCAGERAWRRGGEG